MVPYIEPIGSYTKQLNDFPHIIIPVSAVLKVDINSSQIRKYTPMLRQHSESRLMDK